MHYGGYARELPEPYRPRGWPGQQIPEGYGQQPMYPPDMSPYLPPEQQQLKYYREGGQFYQPPPPQQH